MRSRASSTGDRRRPTTTSTPSGPSSTNVSPSSAFLSRRIRSSSIVGVETGGQVGAQPVLLPDDGEVLVDAAERDATEHVRQVSREDQPDRHRLAVREPMLGRDLERVGERVAVVEDRPAAALAFVGCHDLGLDLDAAGDSVGRDRSPADRRP